MNISELISKMAYLCYSSSFVRSITLEQDGGEKVIRGNIHLFLRAESGSFKSTMLKELASYFKVDVVEMITASGLVGSVDKNTNVVPGQAWRVRNKILLLDEFNTDGENNAIAPLLTLLEDQEYKKVFARHANEQHDKDKDLFFKVKSGEIHMRTRFSCVICSMRKLEKSRSVNLSALLSRCIVIPYDLDNEEIDEVMNGHRLLALRKCPFTKPFEGRIKAADYKKILAYVNEYPGLNKKKQYARIVGDCCRAFVVLGEHDRALYLMITKLHQEA